MLAVFTIFTPSFGCRQRHYAVSQGGRFNSHDSAEKLFWTVVASCIEGVRVGSSENLLFAVLRRKGELQPEDRAGGEAKRNATPVFYWTR